MANISISQFRGKFQKGWIPSSRYSVQWNSAVLYPEQITLPSRSVQLFTDSLYGPIRTWPYRELYSDNIVFTFAEAVGYEMRSNWEAAISSTAFSNNANPTAIDTRTANLTIDILDQNDAIFSTYFVFGAYPVSIVPTNMGYAMMNETQKVQVMIKYYKYMYQLN